VKKKVLVADDEEDICQMLKIVLEKQGWEVETACDGKDALEKIESGPPDLILLDLKMPRINGYHLFAQLKSDEKYKEIPIIIITGLTQDSEHDDEEWARRMDAEGFVTKPFDLEELARRIKELTSKYL